MSENRKMRRPAGQPAAASFVPLALAVAVILVVGVVTEMKSRDLARHIQRTGTNIVLEDLRADLEEAVGDQIDVLARLAGTLSATPAMSEARFMEVARALQGKTAAIGALAASWQDGRIQVWTQAGGLAPRLKEVLEHTSPGESGTASIPLGEAPALVIWSPIKTATPEGGEEFCGHAVAVIDRAQLFEAAGLDAQSGKLDLALVEAEPHGGAPGRALLFGESQVLGRDPVTTSVAMPGGAWTLAAVPSGGWSVTPGAVWPIRLLTLLSIGLVAVPMLRTRALIAERHAHMAQLKSRKNELQRLSQRLGLALDASRVGVWDYNIDTSELIWDARMDELYGMPADGRPRTYADWRSRLHPEDLARAEAEFATCIGGDGKYRSDFRLILPDGAIRHIRATASTHRGSDGELNLIGVNWDVTADVEHRVEIEARRREAEAATQAKSQFLATMSHEIRTPMNGVIGMLDLLLRSDLDTQQRERTSVARKSAEHLLSLLNDVLDLSKLEADRVTLEAAAINPSQIARDVVILMSAVAEERGLRLFMSLDGDVPEWVCGDSTRLRQILTNLVGNALKFTDAGSVELRLGFDARDGGTLSVAVRDTGIGIPESTRAELFTRFAQLESGKRGGTGLGLAICKQLVELMGGEISVDSVEGLGSTFRFRIPAPPAASPEAVAEPQEPRIVPRPAAGRRSARILVAEDNATNQKVLLAYLEMAGHDAHLTPNGAGAVAAVQARHYDLVLMDIQMPVLDGIEATRRIRAVEGPASRLPIIALTANVEPGDRERFLAAGIDDYLTKPVSMTALFEAIGRALEGYSASTTAQASPGS